MWRKENALAAKKSSDKCIRRINIKRKRQKKEAAALKAEREAKKGLRYG